MRANLGQPKSPSADGEGIHALPTLLSFLRIVAEPNILRLGLHQRKLAQIYFWNSLYEILFLDGLAHFADRALHLVDIGLERVIVHRRYAEIEANLITHLQEGWQQLRGWYIWHKNADRFLASQKRSRGEWLTIRKRHAPAILQAALDAIPQRQRSFPLGKDLAELSKTMVPHMRKQTAVTMDTAYAPFGETYNTVTGSSADANFTGDAKDTISDEYDTPARQLHPNQGRWISPDPLGVGAVALANPQTWNRYAYVGNNPLSSTDPTGTHVNADDEVARSAEMAQERDYTVLPPDSSAWYGYFLNPADPPAQSTSVVAKSEPPPQSAEQATQNTCQNQNCSVKVVGDTGKDNGGAGTPNPFVPGVNQREVTYQAVDSKGNAVGGAEISLH